MGERETAQTIDDRAADWVARIDREADNPAVGAELGAWLNGDERRRGAYFRASAAWHMLDRASALGAGRTQSHEASNSGGGLSRRYFMGAGGAAVAAVLVTGLMNMDWFAAPSEQIHTAVGEIRRVPLKDGSLVAVNTQTRLDVTMKREIRRVVLESGEAWFQVAKDGARPFLVEVGDVRVQAIGTAFAVRRSADGIDVRVTEGVVEIWQGGDRTGTRQRLAAGMRAFIAPSRPITPVSTAGDEIDRALAWRTGQLVFDGDTVNEAAAEFNRYNVRKIEVADAALGAQKMVGRFRTNEPDAFAHAVATLMNARVDARPDGIRLSQD